VVIYWINQYAVVDDQPGGTRHVEMARGLLGLGREVTVVASDLNLSVREYTRRSSGDRSYLREDAGGPSFVWLPAGSYEGNDWRRMLSMLTFSLHVLVFLLRSPMPRGSVIVGSSPHLPGAVAARVAAWVRRVPFVFEVRDLWPESLTVGDEGQGALYRVLRVAADALYKTSRSIVVLARGSAAAIVARGVPAERITFIPNGVDPAAFDDAVAVRPPSVPAGVPLLVYAGAHGPANDLSTVLDAMQLLAEREVAAHLVLVGDGPLKAQLQSNAFERGLTNVTFLAPVSKAEIPALMTACRVGVMPLADVKLFQSAVSPNKLFDYLSAGLSIANNVPGEVAAMVEASGAGVSCAPADPGALADAIVTALALPVTTSGREWVAATHSRSVLTKRFDEVLAAVIS
jgi:glycosyltransferase involved in cell wall biosynthesis